METKVETDKKVEKVMTDLGICNDQPQPVYCDTSSDILMYKEHLSLLIARGKTKEFLGKTITFYDLDRMPPKDLEKYYKLYEAAQASRINQSVTNGFINVYTKVCGMIIKPEPVKLEKLNSDLKNDYLVRDQLEQWTSYLSFKLGPFMPLLSAAMITFENLHSINGDKGDSASSTKGDGEGDTTTKGDTSEKTKDSKAD